MKFTAIIGRKINYILNFYNLSSNIFVTFTNFFPALIIEECVSAILLQLIHLPLSLPAIVESTYVYTSIFSPRLPLSMVSPLFVYLSWVALPSSNLSLFRQWFYVFCPPFSVELSMVTGICWPPILHLGECIWISPLV